MKTLLVGLALFVATCVAYVWLPRTFFSPTCQILDPIVVKIGDATFHIPAKFEPLLGKGVQSIAYDQSGIGRMPVYLRPRIALRQWFCKEAHAAPIEADEVSVGELDRPLGEDDPVAKATFGLTLFSSRLSVVPPGPLFGPESSPECTRESFKTVTGEDHGFLCSVEAQIAPTVSLRLRYLSKQFPDRDEYFSLVDDFVDSAIVQP